MLAALILPPDLLDKLQSLAGLNPQQPTVRGARQRRRTRSRPASSTTAIQALITEANLLLSQRDLRPGLASTWTC